MPRPIYSAPFAFRPTALLLIGLLVVSAAISGLTSIRSQADSLIVVNSLSDSLLLCEQSGTMCLRNAIGIADTATSFTTIEFSVSGIIRIDGTNGAGSPLTLSNSNAGMTIDGQTQGITIDGGGTTEIFRVANGTIASINNLTLQNGDAPYTAPDYYGDGGAISNSGDIAINYCNFLDSTAVYSGGGIYNAGTIVVYGSTLSGNKAANGGGMFDNSGTSTIELSSIINNTATANGGGLGETFDTTTINDTTINSNSAATDGGGLYSYYGSISVSGSTVSGNGVGIFSTGGGLYNDDGQDTLSNSTVYGNSATWGDGGLLNLAGHLTIGNSTIAANAGKYVGGLGIGGGTVYLSSSIVADNSVTNVGASPDIGGTITSVGNNLVRNPAGTTGLVASDLIDADPLLGALDNNGGPTFTAGLLAHSPAIRIGYCGGDGAISPALPSLTSDQRGLVRKPALTGCDAGAFETRIPTIDTIGIFRSGTFYLRLYNTQGAANLVIGFTAGTRPYPVVGDWEGYGFDSIGVYDQASGAFSLCMNNNGSACLGTLGLVLGNPNDMPIAGRWSPVATTSGAGVFRPSNGLLYLKDVLATGFADHTMVLGSPGDMGLAGDWTGKGFNSPGIYRPSSSTFYLSNVVTNGIVYSDLNALYGNPGDAPVVGDWTAQGHLGIGLFRQSVGYTYLRNTITTGIADTAFYYGAAGDIPIAGHWQLTYPPESPSTNPAPVGTPLPTSIPGAHSVPGDNQIGG